MSSSVSNNPANLNENRQSVCQLKSLGFAILIILGIGGLVAASIGLAGSLNAPGLGGLSSFNAFTMIGVGGPAGVALVILGIVGSVKNTRDLGNLKKIENAIQTVDTKNGKVYGPEAWAALGLEVADTNIPQQPEVDWKDIDPYFNEPYSKNYVLLYIPQTVKVEGQTKSFALQTLREAGVELENPVSGGVLDKVYTQTPVKNRWVLVSKKNIPNSETASAQPASREYHKKLVGSNNFIPSVIEISALHALMFAFTKNSLSMVTRCEEKCSPPCGDMLHGQGDVFVKFDQNHPFRTVSQNLWGAGVAVVGRF